MEAMSPADLREPLLEVHHALQLVAAAGQAYAEPRPDDSHRATTWSAERGAFRGAPLDARSGARLLLAPHTLTVTLEDAGGDVVDSLALDGRAAAEGYAWLAEVTGQPVPSPDFDIPDHPVAAGAPFGVGREGERAAVASLFASAAEVLEAFIVDRPDAAPVRCWPHHFDIATLLTLEPPSDGDPRRTVGLGMAPMGGGYDTWYWYVNAWPAPDTERLPPLAGPGHWHTEGWTGLVLEPHEIEAARAGGPGRSVVVDFLQRAVPTAERALTG